MRKRTLAYYAAMIITFSAGYAFNWLTQHRSLNDNTSFIYSIISKDNEVYVPPTAWLSADEFRTSTHSVLQSKYFSYDDKNISIILIKGLKNKNGGNEACGMQRLTFIKFNHNDINKILNTATAERWNSRPQ